MKEETNTTGWDVLRFLLPLVVSVTALAIAWTHGCKAAGESERANKLGQEANRVSRDALRLSESNALWIAERDRCLNVPRLVFDCSLGPSPAPINVELRNEGSIQATITALTVKVDGRSVMTHDRGKWEDVWDAAEVDLSGIVSKSLEPPVALGAGRSVRLLEYDNLSRPLPSRVYQCVRAGLSRIEIAVRYEGPFGKAKEVVYFGKGS